MRARSLISRGTALVVSLGLALSLTVASAAERLSDSASPRQRVSAEVEWLGADRPMEKLTVQELNTILARVQGPEVVLDTSRFVGQRAQIFLSLPLPILGLRSPNGLRMEWRTRGVFEAGFVVPGNRSLIFQGEIVKPMLTDIFDFTIRIDSREATAMPILEPIYEIEPL